jgi:hypothetical protein
VARLWLGYGWLNAGYQKLWGSEKAVFWNGGGAGVKGFATAGVTGSATGKGGAVPAQVIKKGAGEAPDAW